jgi:multicomponent Na+:H+ antiporter subunit E
VSAPWAGAAVVRGGCFAVLWWVLAGSTYGLPLAALSVAAATATSLALVPPGAWRWSARGFAAFVPFFFRESVLGGVDVARRALVPGAVLRPGFVDFRTTLPPGPARVFLMNAMNLLPGTLSTGERGDVVRVHVLDLELPTEARLRALEERVAVLFGHPRAGG